MSGGSLKKLLLRYKYTVCGDNRKAVPLFSIAECINTNVLRFGTLLVKNQATAKMGYGDEMHKTNKNNGGF
jgi:hypothetical protein